MHIKSPLTAVHCLGTALFFPALAVVTLLVAPWFAAAADDVRLDYARQLVAAAPGEKRAELKVDPALPGPEAFTIAAGKNGTTVTGGGPAGVLYGVRQWLALPDDSALPLLEKPDFEVRGTSLFLLKDGRSDYPLTPAEFPWFFDRPRLTRFLDYLLENRFNAIFLWGAHAANLSPSDSARNKEQFKWLSDECAKRNIKLLLKDHYDALYAELKHNGDMIVSPAPDQRLALWRDVARKQIVNLYEAADVKPFRWGSPAFIREMVGHWKENRLDGAEVCGMVSWRWPYTLDKLEPGQTGFWPAGKKLLTFERDAIWLEAIGRYLWKIDRDRAGEDAYWAGRLAARFGNRQVGELLRRWYEVTGPILPGLQNLTHVRNMNWHPTAIGLEQNVDWILDPPPGAASYAARPVDAYFFQRYKDNMRSRPWPTA